MKQYFEEIMEAQIVRAIFSNAVKDAKYQKCIIRPVLLKGKKFYQVESFTKDKVYHQNITETDLLATMNELAMAFRQLEVDTESHHYQLRVSKKGKVFCSKREEQNTANLNHNRQKKYLLEEGIVIPVLVDLGIMNEKGEVHKRKYDKYRQINRFVELVADTLKEIDLKRIHIVDFGCGKSYLTFVLYHYLETVLKKEVSIAGIDLKEDVIAECNALSKKYHYQNLKFYTMDINDYQSEVPVDMVISLHACDTATDIAIYKGIEWDAKIMLNVPCCQHEVNQQIQASEMGILTRYGLIQERVSALLTDALRANLIGLCNYDVQILEFIDLEHSPKNILIRSVKGKRRDQAQLTKELQEILSAFHIEPTLYTMLKEGHYVAPVSQKKD